MSGQPRRIDAHHHLWRYSVEEYGWISARMGVLQRDFLPQDLQPLIAAAGITGAVAVQARQSLEETAWLLDMARATSWIRGVVGWVPLAAPELPQLLDGLAHEGLLKGVRHVVQDEPDEDFILGAAFNRGVRALRDLGLVYDILIHTRHLPQAARFVDMHPAQPFVLDHCAKPPLAKRPGGAEAMEHWARAIRALAERPNVCCKLSGLVTEAEWESWTPAELERCWSVVLEAFGASRLLFGSDWPVALLATDYQRWVEVVSGWTSRLSQDEQAAIWGENAARVYGLN